jgi:hypothetical protein
VKLPWVPDWRCDRPLPFVLIGIEPTGRVSPSAKSCGASPGATSPTLSVRRAVVVVNES